MALALVRTKDEIPGSIPGQDYLVFSGELRLGRIHKVAMTGGRERWHWNLFALNILTNNLLCLGGVLAGAALARAI